MQQKMVLIEFADRQKFNPRMIIVLCLTFSSDNKHHRRPDRSDKISQMNSFSANFVRKKKWNACEPNEELWDDVCCKYCRLHRSSDEVKSKQTQNRNIENEFFYDQLKMRCWTMMDTHFFFRWLSFSVSIVKHFIISIKSVIWFPLSITIHFIKWP